jgi:hypothetical protein
MTENQEPLVSMTQEQIEAIARKAIAEHEESKKPKPEPRPAREPGHYETQPSPELKALLLEAFDAAAKEGLNGDNQMQHVFWILYGQSWTGGPGERVYRSHTPDQRTTKLLEEWRGCPLTALDWMGRLQEQGRVANLVRQLDFNRQHPNYVADEVAARTKQTYEIADGLRYWDDARRPADLSVEELEALLAAKRQGSVA